MPSSMADTAKNVSLASSSGRWLSAPGARWTTTAKAISCGIVEAARKNRLKACRAPADAPMATIRGTAAALGVEGILLALFMTRRFRLPEHQCSWLQTVLGEYRARGRRAKVVSQSKEHEEIGFDVSQVQPHLLYPRCCLPRLFSIGCPPEFTQSAPTTAAAAKSTTATHHAADAENASLQTSRPLISRLWHWPTARWHFFAV
jgi:hypothetical protein